MTEDEMVGWHHRLYEHEFEQALGDGEGQGSLVCYSPWGHKELDITQRQITTTKLRSGISELKDVFRMLVLSIHPPKKIVPVYTSATVSTEFFASNQR